MVTKKNINTKIIILFLLFSSFTFTSQFKSKIYALTPAEVFNDEFDQFFYDFLDKTGGNSFAMALINDTDLVHMKGYGDKPGLDTVYQLGLISQLFTATAIMQLYEDGLIDLEDDVNDYLPFNIRHPDYPDIPITIKNLLTQNTSIRDSELYWNLATTGDNLTNIIYELFHEDNAVTGVGWHEEEPGTLITWCSLGYDLLAFVIEIILSTSLMQYLNENIFTPLEMTSTKLNFTEYDEDKLPIPTVITNFNNLTYPHRNYDGRGGVGWRTTIEDFYKYVYCFMHGAYNGISILKQTSIELMLTDYGDSVGLGFLLDFRDFLAGRTSNVCGGLPWAPSLGCSSFFYFDNESCFILLGGYQILHSGFQDDAERFYNFMESSLMKLKQSVEETNHDIFIISTVLCFIGILVNLRRRNKKITL